MHDAVARNQNHILHLGEIGLSIFERLVFGQADGDTVEVVVVVNHFCAILLHCLQQSGFALVPIIVDDEDVAVILPSLRFFRTLRAGLLAVALLAIGAILGLGAALGINALFGVGAALGISALFVLLGALLSISALFGVGAALGISALFVLGALLSISALLGAGAIEPLCLRRVAGGGFPCEGGVTNGFLAVLGLFLAALGSCWQQAAKEEREENHCLFHFFISIDEIKPSGFMCAVTW